MTSATCSTVPDAPNSGINVIDIATRRPSVTCTVLQVARVVPERRRLHGLARERPLDQPQQPLLLGDVVVQDVVFGRRLRPEQIAERLVGQEVVAVGAVHLQPERRVREDPLQQPDGVTDPGEPDGDFVQTLHLPECSS